MYNHQSHSPADKRSLQLPTAALRAATGSGFGLHSKRKASACNSTQAEGPHKIPRNGQDSQSSKIRAITVTGTNSDSDDTASNSSGDSDGEKKGVGAKSDLDDINEDEGSKYQPRRTTE